MGLKVRENGSFVDVGGSAPSDEWVRPSEWPALTIPDASEQKVTGVYAVWPPVGSTDTTWLAMLFQGAYTVDWGDGSAPEDFNSNVKSEHQFDWANCTSAAVDVNEAAAGTTYYIETLGDTSQADWNTLAGTSGLTYAAGDLFNAAVAGSTLGASTGTVSTVPYRFAIVSVTPQAGQNLTTISLTQQPNAGTYADAPQWLDLAISGPNCTSLQLRGLNGVEQRRVERVTIVAHAVTNFQNMFLRCNSLQSVPLFDTSSVTNMVNMFNSCFVLRSVPLFDTSSVTSMTGMFQNCIALQSVPLFDTSSVTSMNSMLRDCLALETVPRFNTSGVTDMTNMLFGSSAIQLVPSFDMSAVTVATGMLSSVTALHTLKAIGAKVSLSLFNCNLSAAALNEVYTNLATIPADSQTITVTGNPGVSGHDPTIAQNKGWLVLA